MNIITSGAGARTLRGAKHTQVPSRNGDGNYWSETNLDRDRRSFVWSRGLRRNAPWLSWGGHRRFRRLPLSSPNPLAPAHPRDGISQPTSEQPDRERDPARKKKESDFENIVPEKKTWKNLIRVMVATEHAGNQLMGGKWLFIRVIFSPFWAPKPNFI